MAAQLVYKRGNLFDAPPDVILAHACNTRGAWGAGIALQFRDAYPRTFESYARACRLNGDDLLGRGYIIHESGERPVGVLFTSLGFGRGLSNKNLILTSTRTAVRELISHAKRTGLEIHSPKFNSGLFKVSWPETEARILPELEAVPEVKWVVWAP
jgi:ADP-ribose 1''-phosphate phosphatase